MCDQQGRIIEYLIIAKKYNDELRDAVVAKKHNDKMRDAAAGNKYNNEFGSVDTDKHLDAIKKSLDNLQRHLNFGFQDNCAYCISKVEDFFTSKSLRNKDCSPRVSIKLADKTVPIGNNTTIRTRRHSSSTNGAVQFSCRYSDNVAFKSIYDTGKYYFTNNVPMRSKKDVADSPPQKKSVFLRLCSGLVFLFRAILSKNPSQQAAPIDAPTQTPSQKEYYNPRLIPEKVDEYTLPNWWERQKMKLLPRLDDEAWYRCWKGYQKGCAPAISDCYKSTIVTPMTLMNNELSSDFWEYFLVSVPPYEGEVVERTIFGYICLDSPYVDFFDEGIDTNMTYFFADCLSIYWIITHFFTSFSRLHAEAIKITCLYPEH